MDNWNHLLCHNIFYNTSRLIQKKIIRMDKYQIRKYSIQSYNNLMDILDTKLIYVIHILMMCLSTTHRYFHNLLYFHNPILCQKYLFLIHLGVQDIWCPNHHKEMGILHSTKLFTDKSHSQFDIQGNINSRLVHCLQDTQPE